MAENLPALVVPPQPGRNPVDQALTWIGFGTEGKCNIIRNEVGLEAFDDFVGLTESNIRDMDSGFSKRNTNQGRINFGMRRVKYTLLIMKWAKY